jgi:hypothetical protein
MIGNASIYLKNSNDINHGKNHGEDRSMKKMQEGTSYSISDIMVNFPLLPLSVIPTLDTPVLYDCKAKLHDLLRSLSDTHEDQSLGDVRDTRSIDHARFPHNHV